MRPAAAGDVRVAAPDEAELLELLALAVGVPSPSGAERALAERLAAWVRRRDPGVPCDVDRFAPGRANLVLGDPVPGHLVVYGHLDTTLSGNRVLDRAAVPGPVPRTFQRRGDTLTGPGLGVAKGPAVAALLGYLLAVRALAGAGAAAGAAAGAGAGAAPGAAPGAGAAPRATLLLAAGGTHRAAPPGTALPAGAPASGAGDGVRRYLARHAGPQRPAAAVVAKCGPPGVLYEEPGAAYVTVEVTGPPGLAMARTAQATGGVPAAVGAAVEGVERWRGTFLARPLDATSQAGREAALGALAAGLPYKADLVGGLLQLHVYAVLAPGDDPHDLPAGLESAVAASLAAAGHRRLRVRARLVDGTAAAGTASDSPVVALAREAYEDAHGAPPPAVTGWTGSTDGVLLRHAGVATARLGPVPLPGPLGRESLSLEGLLAWVRAYAAVVVGWSAGPAGSRATLSQPRR